MIKKIIKLCFFLLFFPIIFLLDYKFVSKSLFISSCLSILYIIYICKLIDCIFNIYEYYNFYSIVPYDKIRKISFNIRKNIYFDSIILFLIAFCIIPYISYFYNTNIFIRFYTSSLFLFIPSITIIASG